MIDRMHTCALLPFRALNLLKHGFALDCALGVRLLLMDAGRCSSRAELHCLVLKSINAHMVVRAELSALHAESATNEAKDNKEVSSTTVLICFPCSIQLSTESHHA